ncbi:BNR-4 repeat-containing protein [Hyunsoonleella sp. SJ7]|uniref:BNR-4 repeat-containing protein n=1 Tax=Hyunsoonleella aquatilis TaxID=2762758 RepID=A0A923HC49_9FLAO|nr:BNR-4 repeat-containing protein [Hyunsoonleella aquatilis]MBC3758669.1 BNR-4 repeat-containing protein [Hyunsoonleella aquatilis]
MKLREILLLILTILPVISNAQVVFEKEVKITDIALHFDGVKVTSEDAPNSTSGYDYAFGPQISAHGDCIFTYKHFVFMTWYKGGKANRNMMLTRYNTETGSMKTIEFPHRHTGWRNVWYIGESHNTIGIGVSPLDGTIHLLFDMHAYTRTRPSDGSLSDDYFRYSYSKKNAAEVPDNEFTLDQFIKDSNDDYTHLSLNGVENHGAFSEFTYPQFFLNTQGDLFFSMRKGSSPNGGYHFAKYDANTSTWSNFIKFADKNAKNFGEPYNWGMYGRLQFVGGKIGIGFQKRSSNTNDRYLYQNGFYFAYSDDQSGQTGWKNYQGESFTTPLRDADKILVYEPGDLVTTTKKNQVYMVGSFDWTITDRGDVHIIGRVRDDENNITKNVHTFKKAGDTEFTTSTDFIGGNRLFTSGNNIYMIRLNSGRIYIEQSLGGTNNFRKVYEATSGKQFSHGRAYVSNGKLYYYMMEQSTGDQRPLYLHIIDLGIDNSPFQVSLISPVNDESYEVDKPLEISAEAFNDNGSISKVEFLINNQVIEEDSTSPYTINYTPETEGTYTIKAIAYDENNASVSSQEINIEVFRRNANDLSGDIYRIKNLATGKYLTSSGSSIITSDSGEGSDKEWQFVKAEVAGFDYYNIDSEVKGTIRFKGGSAGELVSTNFGAPNQAVDKIWTIIVNGDGSFSFETKNLNRYLYHEADGTVMHSTKTDDRSKWMAESTTLSVDENDLQTSSVKIFPNPAQDKFTIVFEGLNRATVTISNILGKVIYSKITEKDRIELSKTEGFSSGLYIVQVKGLNGAIVNKKLVVK